MHTGFGRRGTVSIQCQLQRARRASCWRWNGRQQRLGVRIRQHWEIRSPGRGAKARTADRQRTERPALHGNGGSTGRTGEVQDGR